MSDKPKPKSKTQCLAKIQQKVNGFVKNPSVYKNVVRKGANRVRVVFTVNGKKIGEKDVNEKMIFIKFFCSPTQET